MRTIRVMVEDEYMGEKLRAQTHITCDADGIGEGALAHMAKMVKSLNAAMDSRIKTMQTKKVNLP